MELIASIILIAITWAVIKAPSHEAHNRLCPPGKRLDYTQTVSYTHLAQAAKAAGVNGFAYRGDTGDNIVSDFLPILLANGGWVVDENNKPTVDTPEFKEAVNYYLELIGTGMAMSKDDLTAAVDLSLIHI